MAIALLVCYDIGDDDRREDVSALLSALGPRVQMSVFECSVGSRAELRGLLGRLAEASDPVEDQVRVYSFGGRQAAPTIVGTRELEEWRDFWIL